MSERVLIDCIKHGRQFAEPFDYEASLGCSACLALAKNRGSAIVITLKS